MQSGGVLDATGLGTSNTSVTINALKATLSGECTVFSVDRIKTFAYFYFCVYSSYTQHQSECVFLLFLFETIYPVGIHKQARRSAI